MSLLKQANGEFKKGNYTQSIALYKDLKQKHPVLTEIIDFNINLAITKILTIEGYDSKNWSYRTHDVIVCVYNAPQDVEICINSILDNLDFINKIIIVDDYSNHETVEILNYFKNKKPELIEIIRNKEQCGYTKSANIGLKASKADVCTLLNSDTIVTEKWAKKILSHLNNDKNIGIIGPLSNAASYQSVPSTEGTSTQTAVNGLPFGVTPDIINRFCEFESKTLEIPYTPLVHGFCMSITSKCIQLIGLFDEINFPRGYGEENDFCIRAQDAGFALAIALDTYIFHSKSKSYQSEERIKLMQLGWESLVRKHSKERLVHAVHTMENNPRLIHMRSAVKNKFYTSQEFNNNFIDEDQVKSIAFYLPQFHPIPENDKNWGEGFTEWSNVVKAKPRFHGHYQPKLPSKFGFYDLRIPEIMIEQSKLAREYDLSGFCFYYYRFGEKRVLELPLDNYLKLGEEKLPFCYCWANESWTRAWDGKTSDVLLQQEYDEVTITGFAKDIARAIQDSKYIRIKNRPLVLIYQVAAIDFPEKTIEHIRNKIYDLSGETIFLGSVYSPQFKPEMAEFLDFVVQFPPHRIPRSKHRETIDRKSMIPYEPEKEDYYESYDKVIETSISDSENVPKMFLGCCPDWDNTARRQTNATTLIGSTPEKFKKWVTLASEKTRQKVKDKKIIAPIIFINAWNEWAEGAVLEPSEEYQYQYLASLKEGLKNG